MEEGSNEERQSPMTLPTDQRTKCCSPLQTVVTPRWNQAQQPGSREIVRPGMRVVEAGEKSLVVDPEALP